MNVLIVVVGLNGVGCDHALSLSVGSKGNFCKERIPPRGFYPHTWLLAAYIGVMKADNLSLGLVTNSGR